MMSVSVLIAVPSEGATIAAECARAQTTPVHEIIEQAAVSTLDAWRAAFLRCSGDAVILLTAGEMLAPDHCERLLELLERSPDLGAVMHMIEPEDEPHLIATRLLFGREDRDWMELHDEEGALRELLRATPIFRRSFVETVDLLGVRAPHSRDVEKLWARLGSGDQVVSVPDRTLIAGEYAMYAMRCIRHGAIPAARERIRLMRAAAQSPKVCQQVLMRTALRVTETLDDDELERFTRAMQDALPQQFVTHIDALCHAEIGFSAFRAGRLNRAARGLVKSFRGAPQLIGNVGAWSVIGRAVLSSIGLQRRRNVVQLALQQLGEALGAAPLGVSDTGSGTHGNTFVVRMPHGRVLMRVLRGSDALARAESLARLMQQLRGAQVRVPEVLAFGVLDREKEDGAAAWVAEEFVSADVSEPWRIRRGDAVHLAFELGNQLRRAHELPASNFGTGQHLSFSDWLDAELPYNPEAESRLTHDIRVRLMHARDLLLASHPTAPVVLHADLWPGNYLVTLDGEVVLIDWASARGGDAAFDPAIWYMALRDHDLLDRLLASYAPANPTLFRQRVHAYADLYAASLMSERFSNQRIDAARLHVQARRWLDRPQPKQSHSVALPKDMAEKKSAAGRSTSGSETALLRGGQE